MKLKQAYNIHMILRYLCISCVILFGVISIIGSGGGGGESSGDNTSEINNGWITIDYPTSESSFTTNCNGVYLSGEAFISPTWWRCCSGSAEDTGVTVTWENTSTGESGSASQDVDICGLLSYFLCDHTWNASVSLRLGDNHIVVTASDPAGNTGSDSITVTKPIYTYYISGSVTNADGKALGIKVTDIDLHLSGENLETGAKVSVDGSYGIACIPNGTYTLTATSSMGYTFEPEFQTVVITGSDVSEINFIGNVHFIYGWVRYENDTGVSDSRIDLSSNDSTIFTVYTDDNGYYEVAAPNGTYIITPHILNPDYTISPTNATVTVDNKDVMENFLAVKR